MTGFARADGTLPDGASFLWEVRSVNGRGLDLRLRLPNGLDALEPALRDAAGKAFKRGRRQRNQQSRKGNSVDCCSHSQSQADP